ncbi:MAG: hypothetical protein V3U27_05935 [Candidatus Tectomicrobia bacterium]
MPKKHFSFQKETTTTEVQEPSQDIQRFVAGQQENLARKTIALPQESFVKVKIEAAKRGIPAYRLWGEIVDAYFKDRAF